MFYVFSFPVLGWNEFWTTSGVARDVITCNRGLRSACCRERFCQTNVKHLFGRFPQGFLSLYVSTASPLFPPSRTSSHFCINAGGQGLLPPGRHTGQTALLPAGASAHTTPGTLAALHPWPPHLPLWKLAFFPGNFGRGFCCFALGSVLPPNSIHWGNEAEKGAYYIVRP